MKGNFTRQLDLHKVNHSKRSKGGLLRGVRSRYRFSLKGVVLFFLFMTVTFAQAQETPVQTKNNEAEQEWTRERVDSLVKSIREYFDELLDVELGWAALQARHLSNVGYGIDNRIGLNGELRDTLEFLRNVFESELFVKSMLKYDHFWPNLINRKQYSPKPNELEKQHDGLYAQSLYFDIVFYPSWDTVAMDVDVAREAGKIGYKCTIAVNGLGEFEADLDGDEMSRILNGLITGKEYTKIKQQADPDVNESMMAGLGWLAEKFDYRPFDDPTNIKRVDFYAPVSQNYGYDAYENAILSGNYDNVSIKGKQYHVPWKSAAVSASESIMAIVKLKEKDKPAGAKLKFITTTGQEAQQVTRADDTTYHVVLPPVTSEGEFGLLATYSYKNEEDKEITVNAGQANISGYTTNPKKVVIVPVNGNKEGLTATGLKKALDEIYKQAATTWDVEIYTGNLQVKSVYADDGKLDDGKPGLLSNYTEEMSEIIKTFKDRPGVHIDKNTCYLFLVDKAKSGPGKCGFMPLKRPFGFIFTDSRCSNNISHTIAHELGHGPFRLYHTFSSENEYKQGKGTTDNLMDYMTSTEKLGENKALYKYQWDLIHDPESMFFAWAQDEEEGAFGILTHQNMVAEAITKIDGSLELNERNFKLLISTGLLADGGSILCEVNNGMKNAEITEELSVYLNSKISDLYTIFDSPYNILKRKWIDYWSTSIEFPNMRNVFRRSWQYGSEMKESIFLFKEYFSAVAKSDVKFEKLVITPNNQFKIELLDITLLEHPEVLFDLLFQMQDYRMQDYMNVTAEMETLVFNGEGIDLIPEWISTDVNVNSQTSLSIRYFNKDQQSDLFKVTFDVNASLVNSVELVMSLNDIPFNFPLTCEEERIEIHFDSKYESSDVKSEWSKLNNKLNGIASLDGDGAIDLGLILHNVADFYSHSNFIIAYIDWWMEQPDTDIKTLKPEDIPTYEEVVLGTSNTSGVDLGAFWQQYEAEMFTGAWTLELMMDRVNQKEMDLPRPFHDDIALDSPDSGRGSDKPDKAALCNYFEYARGAASKHLYKILKDKLK